MLFHGLDAGTSGVDLEQVVGTLEEELDEGAFRSAWARVMARHPVLRTAFRWEGLATPRQEVHREAELPWERLDWRDMPPGVRQAQCESFLARDRQRAFDLTQPPLMRLTLAAEGRASWTFVWTFHHALLDGRSFPL